MTTRYEEPAAGAGSPAALAGSLAVFNLADVLRLLAAGGVRGELVVIGPGFEGRLWLDGGRLVGSAVGVTTTISQAAFELALLQEGWFTFSVGPPPPASVDPEEVGDVLARVLPQVVEWRELLRVVPLDAAVRLVPTPPGPEVQIRAEQWQILTSLGPSGASVRGLVDALPLDQVTTLRLLRDLADAGLVEVSRADPAAARDPTSSPAIGHEPAGGTVGTAEDPSTAAGLPPPISSDPWAAPPAQAPGEPVPADASGPSTST